MKKSKDILIFEGAGSTREYGDLENPRIRTRFKNNDGIEIYLEVLRTAKNKIYVDFCFSDKENNNEYKEIRKTHKDKEYNKKDLLKLINSSLNCSFKDIIVPHDLGGYRAHSENGGYNLMDNFIYDPVLEKKREEIKKYFYEIEKKEGKKYPNFSLWVDKKDLHKLHLLKHFNGYNKHYTVRTDTENFIKTISECKLNKYGC